MMSRECIRCQITAVDLIDHLGDVVFIEQTLYITGVDDEIYCEGCAADAPAPPPSSRWCA